MNDLKNQYEFFDKDKDGFVSKEEFVKTMRETTDF